MIYLDAAADTTYMFGEDNYPYYNPNSKHQLGLQAKHEVEKAKKKTKDFLGVKSGEIIFDSNASRLYDDLTRNIRMGFCSPYEHHCVSSKCFKKPVKEVNDYLSYSHMWVNNLTGDIFNLAKIRNALDPKVMLFVDGTAGVGKIKIPDNLENLCDAFFFSGHKVHGPKGIGAMWVSDRAMKECRPQALGTPDVQSISILAKALDWCYKQYDRIWFIDLGFNALNDIFKQEGIVGCHPYFKSTFDNLPFWHSTSQYIFPLTIPGVYAPALVNYLSEHGIFTSAFTSACDSEKEDYSVPIAMGYTEEEARSTIRISVEYDITAEQMVETFKAIAQFIKEYV